MRLTTFLLLAVLTGWNEANKQSDTNPTTTTTTQRPADTETEKITTAKCDEEEIKRIVSKIGRPQYPGGDSHAAASTKDFLFVLDNKTPRLMSIALDRPDFYLNSPVFPNCDPTTLMDYKRGLPDYINNWPLESIYRQQQHKHRLEERDRIAMGKRPQKHKIYKNEYGANRNPNEQHSSRFSLKQPLDRQYPRIYDQNADDDMPITQANPNNPRFQQAREQHIQSSNESDQNGNSDEDNEHAEDSGSDENSVDPDFVLSIDKKITETKTKQKNVNIRMEDDNEDEQDHHESSDGWHKPASGLEAHSETDEDSMLLMKNKNNKIRWNNGNSNGRNNVLVPQRGHNGRWQSTTTTTRLTNNNKDGEDDIIDESGDIDVDVDINVKNQHQTNNWRGNSPNRRVAAKHNSTKLANRRGPSAHTSNSGTRHSLMEDYDDGIDANGNFNEKNLKKITKHRNGHMSSSGQNTQHPSNLQRSKWFAGNRTKTNASNANASNGGRWSIRKWLAGSQTKSEAQPRFKHRRVNKMQGHINDDDDDDFSGNGFEHKRGSIQSRRNKNAQQKLRNATGNNKSRGFRNGQTGQTKTQTQTTITKVNGNSKAGFMAFVEDPLSTAIRQSRDVANRNKTELINNENGAAAVVEKLGSKISEQILTPDSSLAMKKAQMQRLAEQNILLTTDSENTGGRQRRDVTAENVVQSNETELAASDEGKTTVSDEDKLSPQIDDVIREANEQTSDEKGSQDSHEEQSSNMYVTIARPHYQRRHKNKSRRPCEPYSEPICENDLQNPRPHRGNNLAPANIIGGLPKKENNNKKKNNNNNKNKNKNKNKNANKSKNNKNKNNYYNNHSSKKLNDNNDNYNKNKLYNYYDNNNYIKSIIGNKPHVRPTLYDTLYLHNIVANNMLNCDSIEESNEHLGDNYNAPDVKDIKDPKKVSSDEEGDIGVGGGMDINIPDEQIPNADLPTTLGGSSEGKYPETSLNDANEQLQQLCKTLNKNLMQGQDTQNNNNNNNSNNVSNNDDDSRETGSLPANYVELEYDSLSGKPIENDGPTGHEKINNNCGDQLEVGAQCNDDEVLQAGSLTKPANFEVYNPHVDYLT